MRSKQPHRGSINDPGKFAKKFVLARMDGFQKDIQICLTPIPSKTRPSPTHAYFPALAACCGTLEYLTALHCGRVGTVGWRDVAAFAGRYLPQPDYSVDSIRVFVEAFRNSVAHRGIARGIWVDRKSGPDHGRRITWKILANAVRPSIRILPEQGMLRNDPPWPCQYTHRVHIHLKSLEVDIRKAAKRYANDVFSSSELQDTFASCMHRLYPK
jgi:hypothetical protein